MQRWGLYRRSGKAPGEIWPGWSSLAFGDGAAAPRDSPPGASPTLLPIDILLA